ncbi:MAG: SUMF1/EgtB/PvdO family nonheme iron enzyme [Acidobacteriia bacterium]|nr:SUMF1/EgtB/PvdO family nonheme iron enzyme [Terriglobia bacterium]
MAITAALTAASSIDARTVLAAGPVAGDKKVNSRDGLTYVWTGKGRFTMGCSEADPSQCTDLEKPAHNVTISRGVWIGQTEVTQEAYKRVMGKNPSRFEGDRTPVENLTWEEAASYCKAVSGRLPTEAEWEFAARGGEKRGRVHEDVSTGAWFADNSGGHPHEVGQKNPNALGLYDTLGNVWEWVADWFAPQYTNSDQRDPHGPAKTAYRTIRGDAWYDEGKFLRVSFRTGVALNFHLNVGVRCVSE